MTQDEVLGNVLDRVVQERYSRESVEAPDQAPAGSVAEASQQFFRHKQGHWTVSLTQLQASRTFGDLWVGLPIHKPEYAEDLLPIQLPGSIATQTFEDVRDTLIEADILVGDTVWGGLPPELPRRTTTFRVRGTKRSYRTPRALVKFVSCMAGRSSTLGFLCG